MKFKVGDIVRANSMSNNIYSVTNQKNKWKGRVTKIVGTEFDAVDTDYNSPFYSLRSEYFENEKITNWKGELNDSA